MEQQSEIISFLVLYLSARLAHEDLRISALEALGRLLDFAPMWSMEFLGDDLLLIVSFL